MPINSSFAQGELTTSAVDLFVATANNTTVNLIRITNIDGSAAADVTVSRVPSGGSARAIASTQTVPADAALRIEGPIFLNNGDKLTGLASAAGDLVFHIEYVVRT
jgi:hypothetical protein